MNEWNETVQAMIDWIEENPTENSILIPMSKSIGYSPYYCSAQFHRVVGITIKAYSAGRRLTKAAIDIRDTKERIIDIALKYGFSSQGSLTRAFSDAYGCTPSAYRKNPQPIVFLNRKNVLYPCNYISKGDKIMKQFCLKAPKIRVEYIPEHSYIGIWDDKSVGFGDFWQRHNCDEVCGIIESMRNVSNPVVSCHMAGWHYINGERRYFYGLGVSSDYDGEIPNGFEMKKFPGSYYLVFFHPTYDYLSNNDEIMNKVEKLAWGYNIQKLGLKDITLDVNDCDNLYEWNEEECQCYQRHYPEVLGYEILRPIKKCDPAVKNSENK